MNSNKNSLEALSRDIRLKILNIVYKSGGGHIGGSYSVTDILVTLYHRILKHDPLRPDWDERDFLIFSKGHCCLALYTVLNQCNYFSEDLLKEYSQNGSNLGGHPKKGDAPGIEATTGSLGHGLAIANGIALSTKIKNKANRVFTVMSDGEMNEGSVWESIMFASQQKLDNLILIVDNNNQISLDKLSNILSVEPLDKRFKSFGWFVSRVDGHNHNELLSVLNELPKEKDKPTVIIADTIKGKGVSFMEGVTKWHYRGPSEEEFRIAKKEIIK